IASRSTKSYDMLESDDFGEGGRRSPAAFLSGDRDKPSSPDESLVPLRIPRPKRRPSPPATTVVESTASPRTKSPGPLIRTASGQSIALRHPTPDLQTLQGAYTGNIQ